MAETETKRFERTGDARQVSMPVATVAALLASFVSAGGTSSLMGSSAREGQIRIEGRLDAMAAEMRRQGDDQRTGLAVINARLDAQDDRLRAVELHQARSGGPAPPR